MGKFSFKVLITEPEAYDDDTRAQFPPDWHLIYQPINNQDQLRMELVNHDYDIVFAKLGLSFDQGIFLSQPHLKIVATPTTGLNHIDLIAAEAANILVVSLKGERQFLSTVTSTAEHAWLLLLAISRSLPVATSRVASGQWERQGMEVHELRDAQLGIIGMGRLGKIVASYGLAFGMNIVASDPNIEVHDFPEGVYPASLKHLLSTSDYIVLLASYTPGAPPILGVNEFSVIKPGASLVNVARGELIDENALLDALKQGSLRAAGLDVLSGDSVWNASDNPYSSILEFARSSSRVIITPHMAGYAFEAVKKTRLFLIDKVKAKLSL